MLAIFIIFVIWYYFFCKQQCEILKEYELKTIPSNNGTVLFLVSFIPFIILPAVEYWYYYSHFEDIIWNVILQTLLDLMPIYRLAYLLFEETEITGTQVLLQILRFLEGLYPAYFLYFFIKNHNRVLEEYEKGLPCERQNNYTERRNEE